MKSKSDGGWSGRRGGGTEGEFFKKPCGFKQNVTLLITCKKRKREGKKREGIGERGGERRGREGEGGRDWEEDIAQW